MSISDERLAELQEALDQGRVLSVLMESDLAVMFTELQSLRAAAKVRAIRGDGEWQPIETAPVACTLLAAYFDEDVGEWIVQIFVADKPTAPFTHWQFINSPRGPWTAASESHGTHDLNTPTDNLEAGAGDLVELLDEYWDLAYAEGKEGRSHDTEGGDAQRVRSAIAARIQELTAERDAAEDAENQAKDCFWAIYHDWVELKGHGLSTEAARTMLAERAVTAEARVKALLDLIESNGSGSMIRAARAALSQEAKK